MSNVNNDPSDLTPQSIRKAQLEEKEKRFAFLLFLNDQQQSITITISYRQIITMLTFIVCVDQ
jgi:hypothetical protein